MPLFIHADDVVRRCRFASPSSCNVAVCCVWQDSSSRTAGYNSSSSSYHDVTPRLSYVTSAQTLYSSQRDHHDGLVGSDVNGRPTPADSNASSSSYCVPPDCSCSSSSPRRSILKKPAGIGTEATPSGLKQLRRSAYSAAANPGVCRQQVLAGERAIPARGGVTERSRTATTKRVTFCVWY